MTACVMFFGFEPQGNRSPMKPGHERIPPVPMNIQHTHLVLYINFTSFSVIKFETLLWLKRRLLVSPALSICSKSMLHNEVAVFCMQARGHPVWK